MQFSVHPPRAALRSGFSLIEALMSVVVTTIAGAALITAISTSLKTSVDMAHTRLAQGLAEQMLLEIAAAEFPDSSSTRPAGNSARTEYDDLDDYDGCVEQPPLSRHRIPLGVESHAATGPRTARPEELQARPDLLAQFRRRVLVEPVDLVNGQWEAGSAGSDHRRVTVVVEYVHEDGTERELVSVSQIISRVH